MNKLILFALVALVASEGFQTRRNSRFGIGSGIDGRFGSSGGGFRDNKGGSFGGIRSSNFNGIGNNFDGRRNFDSRGGSNNILDFNKGNSFGNIGNKGGFGSQGNGGGFGLGGGFNGNRGSSGSFGFGGQGNGGGFGIGGGINGNGFGNNGFGSSFSDFDNQANSLRAADRENEIFDAENNAAFKDGLNFQADAGARAAENKNFNQEEYEKAQNFRNVDADNQVQYAHDKQEHVIDRVNFGQKNRVSENNGEKFDAGRKELNQQAVNEEAFNNENLQQLTDEQRQERANALLNSERVFDDQNLGQSATQDFNY